MVHKTPRKKYYVFRGVRFEHWKGEKYPYVYSENPNIQFATKEDAQDWVMKGMP